MSHEAQEYSKKESLLKKEEQIEINNSDGDSILEYVNKLIKKMPTNENKEKFEIRS